ncbi:uncharacterized protein LOC131708135 [Acipenser ruthenus]|uniref:uncharacterized protein LOC131708135 n=1 Tax=Acipenser ruthenus TaxID=7906 RepID=UPI00145A6B2E|nr:uncharacterized protein LOC131708135 [Acipenser ruthenus]
MEATPSFRRVPGSKDLLLQHTPEAASVSAATKAATVRFVAKAPEEVRSDAVAHVVSQGGDPGNSMLVLSQSTVQFGKYRGQTFQWLLANDMGYAVSLVTSHQREREGDSSMSPYMANKDALTSYACAFPDVASAVRDRRAQDVARLHSSQPGQEDLRLVAFGVHKDLAWRDLYEATDKEKRGYVKWLRRQTPRTGTQMEALQKYILRRDQESRSPASSQAGSSQAVPTQLAPSRPASPRPGTSQPSPTPARSPLASSLHLRPRTPKVVPRAPSAQGVSKRQPASPAFWEEVTDTELVAICDVAPPTND